MHHPPPTPPEREGSKRKRQIKENSHGFTGWMGWEIDKGWILT